MKPVIRKLGLVAPSIAWTLLLALQPQAQANGDNRIEGTWINSVRIVPCASPQTVLAAFQSMTTYHRDGTLIEGGGPATPPPGVSRSAGHGVWERTGRHSIQAHFRSHTFDSLGRLVRITEVTTTPKLTPGDDPTTTVVEPYHLAGWGSNKITNVDPVSGAVVSVTEGCNYATSWPVLFD
jgi:hypothetical protein